MFLIRLLVSVIRLSEHDLLVGKILEITRKLLFEFAHGFPAIVCGAGIIRCGPVEKIQFYDLLLSVPGPFKHRILKTFEVAMRAVSSAFFPRNRFVTQFPISLPYATAKVIPTVNKV